MSSQISDLFKRIKELEDQQTQQKDKWDSDYQNILDKQKETIVRDDSLRTSIAAITTKIDKLTEKIEKVEKELGIDEPKPNTQQYMGYFGI